MKRKMFIIALTIALLMVSFNKGNCQNGTNVLIEDGTLTAYFSPDAIGTYYLTYRVEGYFNWNLTVVVSWQSDTYPGWHDFYDYTFTFGNVASDMVVLNSLTDDNVRYRVIYWTNSATAYATWTFY